MLKIPNETAVKVDSALHDSYHLFTALAADFNFTREQVEVTAAKRIAAIAFELQGKTGTGTMQESDWHNASTVLSDAATILGDKINTRNNVFDSFLDMSIRLHVTQIEIAKDRLDRSLKPIAYKD